MTAPQLELYVRALAPKLLFQAGIAMLHASACFIDQSLIAFSGLSGAGKTTTAQAFQGAGAELVSEELLVFAPDGPSAVVITGGEALVFEWSRTAASELREHRCSASMTKLITDLVSGSTSELREIVFLDHTRRRGTEFTTEKLQGASSLAELFRHHFLGAAETDAWRRFFQVAVALVETVEMRLGWSPEGIDHLPGAAARYIPGLCRIRERFRHQAMRPARHGRTEAHREPSIPSRDVPAPHQNPAPSPGARDDNSCCHLGRARRQRR